MILEYRVEIVPEESHSGMYGYTGKPLVIRNRNYIISEITRGKVEEHQKGLIESTRKSAIEAMMTGNYKEYKTSLKIG